MKSRPYVTCNQADRKPQTHFMDYVVKLLKKKPTILIVDDEKINVDTLAYCLQDYQVETATSGSEALEMAFSSASLDLVLLDIVMPGMDGFQVCQKLKKNLRTQKIPIIFLTAMSDEKNEEKGFALGAVDYITKPFRLSVIQARVKNHLQLKASRDLLENLSTIDFLTDIPNRRLFEDVLMAEWRHAMRAGTLLSIIIIDIDFFKLYNDHYGHLAGDNCLKKLAAALASTLNRSTDFLARYGGEEFITILPQTDAPGALNIGVNFHKVILELAITHAASPISDNVTVSLGVATCKPGDNTDPKDLIQLADNMLYKAKAEGRNCIKTASMVAKTT